MAPQIYWRSFTRNGSEDDDKLADSQFLNDHLTDYFGKWLQRDNHTEIQSHHGLVMEFFGKSFWFESRPVGQF
jgi:hypothetical protein